MLGAIRFDDDSVAKAPVNIDLCSSDDDADDGDRKAAALPWLLSRKRGVASASTLNNPLTIDEDGDDDDDDSDGIATTPMASGLKRSHDSTAEIDIDDDDDDVLIIDDDLDRKPAAAAQPITRRTKRARRQEGAVQVLNVKPPADPLHFIYEAFPNVDPAHAKKLYAENNSNVDRVVSLLASATTFPTVSNGNANNPNATIIKRQSSASADPKYDYMSKEAFHCTPEYQHEATSQLLYEFRFLNKNCIIRMLKTSNWHYSIARKIIFDNLANDAPSDQDANNKPQQQGISEDEIEIKNYRNIRKVLLTHALSDSQKRRFGAANILKKMRRCNPGGPSITDPILADELRYVREKHAKWSADMEAKIKRKRVRAETEMAGTGIECSCCFDNVPIDEMVACRNEGHLFCADCLGSFAKNQIFGSGNLGIDPRTKQPSMELMCFHGDGCHSPFAMEHLQKALGETTMEKYNALQCKISLGKAGLGDCVVACPKCDYKVELPESQMVLNCPVEDCGFASCRKCGKASHIPLRCDEVEKEKAKDEGRLAVEEAISRAKIRKCPKCNQQFIKSDGCNKITCSCGAKICYVCRAPINGYEHFCQKPHCDHKSCGKCRLYTNDAEDDKRAMREAGITTADEFKERDVEIDVNQLL